MFDTMIIGQITLDHNIDYDGREEFINGGAVTFSGYAAAAIGHSVAVVPKGDVKVIDPDKVFSQSRVERVFAVDSDTYTEMQNTYFTADRERRRCLNTKGIEPYQPSDLPDADAKIYHLGGLVAGDFPGAFVKACAARGDVGLDVQGMMRFRNDDGTLQLRDWPEKKEYLPLIRYLKTDAAEAEILTGTDDREKAAFQLCEWGAKEVLITHNTEALVCDGSRSLTAEVCVCLVILYDVQSKHVKIPSQVGDGRSQCLERIGDFLTCVADDDRSLFVGDLEDHGVLIGVVGIVECHSRSLVVERHHGCDAEVGKDPCG